jgi:hypothetical protein
MLSEKDSNLIIAAERIRSDDKEADRIGAKLVQMLHLRRAPQLKGQWQTRWGTKTNAGVARCIIAVLEESLK